MRKTFTLIALLSGIAAAQAQIAFPSANATWTERHGQGEAAPSYAIIGLKSSDVVIGGVTYHKVYRSTNDAVLDESEYIGGLREDAGKVYYMGASASAEKLIYDFNVAVGDTITDPATGTKNGVVHSIETVMIGSVSHKRINFRQFSSTNAWPIGSWIDGIGNSSLGGLLGSPMMQPTCDCGTNTVCLTKNSVQEYKNPVYASVDCESSVSAASVKMNIPAVAIMPNPVTGTSHLAVPAEGKFHSIAIYDMMGRKAYDAPLNGAMDIAISKGTFAPGVYMYHLSGANGIVTGKFTVE
ncbi:hypothetical protein GCM10023093_03910 [Nemorincola caseinilytica]|uniref:T9SS C-terminal target domain-containing protein n=1 Tax=Nemorincola caseinilytica TaxID=2054315 RepID=A0ABP8N7V9_9BACT